MASAPSQASRRRPFPTEQPASQADDSWDGGQTGTSLADEKSVNVTDLREGETADSSPTPQLKTPPREVRRCWVCMGDETDDTPENHVWRSPCPCSLTAHEACLLEWVADKEAPAPGQMAHSHEIKCPQCQAPIKIQRPRDPLVSAVDGVQMVARTLILPSAMAVVGGCIFSGFVSYGANAMGMVFGTEATDALLAAGVSDSLEHANALSRWLHNSGILGSLFPFFPRGRNHSGINTASFLGLPLIAPSLIALRTKYGEMGFSLLIPFYFLDPANHKISWPPSPGLAFLTIPYLKSAYSELYKHTFADLEKKWDLAVQRTPREGETAEQIAAQAANEEEHAIFEVEIIRNVEEDAPPNNQGGDGRQNGEAQNQGQVQQQPGNNPPVEGAALANGDNAQAQPNQPGWQEGWEIRQDMSATLSADTIMGALFFPAVAAAMGEVLKISLPAKWVGRGIDIKVGGKGLLMEKWGRSLVGGCLFVVLKDVVTLYCKWRKAKDFGKRKIVDFVGKKGRVTGEGVAGM